MQIGVLALQGAFIEHEQMLSQISVPIHLKSRRKRDLG